MTKRDDTTIRRRRISVTDGVFPFEDGSGDEFTIHATVDGEVAEIALKSGDQTITFTLEQWTHVRDAVNGALDSIGLSDRPRTRTRRRGLPATAAANASADDKSAAS